MGVRVDEPGQERLSGRVEDSVAPAGPRTRGGSRLRTREGDRAVLDAQRGFADP